MGRFKLEVLIDVKKLIDIELRESCCSFNRIGFYLKKIRDEKLYIEAGHKDIWEYAQDQFGISRSSASRFMSINDRFSVGGNSDTLINDYTDYSASKLSEMLTLSDDQLVLVTPSSTVKEIRDIKRADKVQEVIEVDEIDKDCATSQEIVFDEIDIDPCDTDTVDIDIELDDEEKDIEDIVIDVEIDGEEVLELPSINYQNKEQDEIHKDDPEYFNEFDVRSYLDARIERLDELRNGKMFVKAMRKTAMEVAAFGLLMEKLAETDEIKNMINITEQPPMPILRNNDMRKDFIDSYRDWPVWFEVDEAGERYYRYNFDNDEAIAVKDALKHKWVGYRIGYSADASYELSKYYLIKNNSDRLDLANPTFNECEANKSELVDYLKDLNKRGK